MTTQTFNQSPSSVGARIRRESMPTVSDGIKQYEHNGRMTLGYYVRHNDKPVYVGTWSECCTYGTDLGTGAVWTIKDARGLEVR